MPQMQLAKRNYPCLPMIRRREQGLKSPLMALCRPSILSAQRWAMRMGQQRQISDGKATQKQILFSWTPPPTRFISVEQQTGWKSARAERSRLLELLRGM